MKWLAWLWAHRTKIVGILAMGVGYAQNNLAQLGHVLPPSWHGVLIAAFGIITFCIGLYNSIAAAQ